MDACFEILLSTRQTLEYLECHQETFTWGGVEYPQAEKYYLWGKYIKLVEREISPHIIKHLPAAYQNIKWLNFSVQGKGLDLLESEVNGSEIDWEGKSFDKFLKLILTEQPQWVVVFEWHCDRIDSLYDELNVSECISQIKNNLKWDNNREGFMVLSCSENRVCSSTTAGEVSEQDQFVTSLPIATPLSIELFSNTWLPIVAFRRFGLWCLRTIPPVRFVSLRLMTGLMGRPPELGQN